MNPLIKNTVFYDGHCKLCNSFVEFLVRIDKRRILEFKPLQSETFKEISAKHYKQRKLPDSIIYIDNQEIFESSDAVLKIFQDLGGAWKIFGVLKIIPAPIRNFIYKLVAKYRYKVFGKSNSCYLPENAPVKNKKSSTGI